MNQEGRGIGLLNKLKAVNFQEQGRDTVEANLELDWRRWTGLWWVRRFFVILVFPNEVDDEQSKEKEQVWLDMVLKLLKLFKLKSNQTSNNKLYLITKRDKMGHTIKIDND